MNNQLENDLIEENKIIQNSNNEIEQNQLNRSLHEAVKNIIRRSNDNLSIEEDESNFKRFKSNEQTDYILRDTNNIANIFTENNNKSNDNQILQDNKINSLFNDFSTEFLNQTVSNNQLFDSNQINQLKIDNPTLLATENTINYSFNNLVKNEPSNNEFSNDQFKDNHLFSNDILKNHQLLTGQYLKTHKLKFDITIKDYTVPTSFDQLERKKKSSKPKSFQKYDKFNNEIKKAILSLGIRRPTHLQEKIIEALDNDKDDIFIKAGLFTNKELAYLVSAFTRIDILNNRPQILIILPTFELVQQVIELAKLLVKFSNIQIVSTQRSDDITKLIIGHVFVTTIGTITTISNNYSIDISRVKLAIFDEIDILMNSQLGRYQITKLKSELSCQSLIFSSTFSDNALNFVKTITSPKKLIHFDLLEKNDCFKNILHFYVPCFTKKECYYSLLNIFRQIIIKKVLICVISKKAANFVIYKLNELNLNVPIILLTSDISFQERLNSINIFKNNSSVILISIYPHYVNLNLNDVSLILNYDLPYDTITNQTREYNHKLNLIGHNKPGFVINLIDESLMNDQFNRRKILEDFIGMPMIRLKTSYKSTF